MVIINHPPLSITVVHFSFTLLMSCVVEDAGMSLVQDVPLSPEGEEQLQVGFCTLILGFSAYVVSQIKPI